MELDPDTEQTFLLGLARSSASVDATVLAKLSLAGQKRRFEQSAASGPSPRLAIADDPRPILPQAARRLFLRLFADAPKSPTDRLEEAAIAALDAAGRRLHPFDLAALESLVLRRRFALGPAVASWAAMVRPIVPDDERRDGPAVAHLRQSRERAPDHTRSEVEVVFPSYPAAQRLAVLDALLVGLGQGDVAFLSRLEHDKAPTVRERAAELLGTIPGTPTYASRLARVRDHLTVQTTGLVFKKKNLVVQGITQKSGSLWQLLKGLRIDDVAVSIGLVGRALVELAADTDGLDEVILHAVLAERRYELSRQFEKRLSDDGTDWIMMLHRLLPAANTKDREELLEICINPEQWSKFPAAALSTLQAAWGAPLPAPIARRLLRCDAWNVAIDAARTAPGTLSAGVLESLAALVPVTLSQDFIADVEPLSRRVADYHRFLLALAEEAS